MIPSRNGFLKKFSLKLEEFSEVKKSFVKLINHTQVQLLKTLDPRQMETGELIVILQLTQFFKLLHTNDIIPLDELYRICEPARSKHLEASSSSRAYDCSSFTFGEPGTFTRTSNRRDMAVSPFAPTV